MKKTLLVVYLVVCLGLAVFATGGTEAAGTTATGAGKPDLITFMVDGTFVLTEDNGGEELFEDAYKAFTGVDLKIIHPEHNDYRPTLDLAFATGDPPDVFVLGSDQYVKFAAAGALYDMTDLYANSRMQNNMMNQDFVDAMRLDGRLWGIPNARGNGTITYVRMDWLEKLGMDPPTDYDEFIDMLRAFKNNNPDGLAPDEVIPITGAGLAGPEYPMDIYMREFYQDARPDYYLKNGTWVDGMLEPNMRGALTRMRDAYAEGLIDTEIITNQTSTCRNKFFSGIVGAFNYWAGYWNDRLQEGIAPNVPDAKVRGIPAIRESYYVERPSGAVGMASTVDNPEGIFEYWFEPINDAGVGQTLFTFGIEGITYEEVNGVKVFLPLISDPTRLFNKIWVDPAQVITNFSPEYEKLPFIDPSYAIFNEYRLQYGLPSASEELGKLQSEINEVKKSIIARIVFGDYSVDEGLGIYANEIRRYNDIVLPDMNR